VKHSKKLALGGIAEMYKFDRNHQLSLSDFNQPLGMEMNAENRWVKKAAMIPWENIEDRYAELFPSEVGMPAKPLQTALGSLLIQKEYGYSDRELVEQIKENPYYQYFIGRPGYEYKAPFVPSLLVEFRKRLNEDVLAEINEMIAAYNSPDDSDGGSDISENRLDENTTKETIPENKGTLILDATCVPQNIAYPQDINLLNEARENLEAMIDQICAEYNFYKPRMYRENARKDYLALAKCRKRTGKKVRKAIGRQLRYVSRDLGYVDMFVRYNNVTLTEKQKNRLYVLQELYEQQKYMYENKTHSVKDRIVSISQPYIRPIVRGKAKSPVEFGAKIDMSIDENGMARLEKLSFDAYNEEDVLIGAIQNYYKRTGHYPQRVLVDQIYRNRKNIAYCKSKKIRISGKALGRPKKASTSEELKIVHQDNTDRIEVERGFSLAKRCFGMGLIRTKLDITTRSSIALSILAMNLSNLARAFLLAIFYPIFLTGLGYNESFEIA